MSATNAPEDAMEIEQQNDNTSATKSPASSDAKPQQSTPQNAAAATNGQEPTQNSAQDEAKIIEQKIEEVNKEIQAVFQGMMLYFFFGFIYY